MRAALRAAPNKPVSFTCLRRTRRARSPRRLLRSYAGCAISPYTFCCCCAGLVHARARNDDNIAARRFARAYLSFRQRDFLTPSAICHSASAAACAYAAPRSAPAAPAAASRTHNARCHRARWLLRGRGNAPLFRCRARARARLSGAHHQARFALLSWLTARWFCATLRHRCAALLPLPLPYAHLRKTRAAGSCARFTAATHTSVTRLPRLPPRPGFKRDICLSL